MFVLGTAGHIDHGKSVLVKALTGIDPDRLREERERGMTIDLGFAWLTLPSGQEVGIVDVPGHERFVKNMLAGVGGIESVVRQGETGYVVKDNAPIRLADRIAALLSRPDAGAQSASSVRASVLKFGWPNIAAAIVEEYELVLASYAARVC